MNAYDIEGMKKDIYTFGDYTKAEVEKMSVHEILQAWTSLPATVIWG